MQQIHAPPGMGPGKLLVTWLRGAAAWQGRQEVGAQARWCHQHSACMLPTRVDGMKAMAPIRLPAAVVWTVPALQSDALIHPALLQAGRTGSGGRSVGPALRILRPCERLLFSTPQASLRALSHTCWPSSLYLHCRHSLLAVTL